MHQSATKALAVLDGVQALEIFRVGFPWLHVEVNEERAIFL
jgi:hypothetical protein